MHRDEDFDLTRFLPYLIGRIGLHLNTVIGAELQAQGITLPMWRVIGVLWQRKMCSMGELSDAANVTLTALSRLVGAMDRDGIVKRQRSAGDARVVIVTLTRRGTGIARRLIPPSLALERHLLAKLTAGEARALRSTLATVYEALGDEIKATT